MTRALAMIEDDRAELASRLLLSLESDESSEDRAIAWGEEIQRRRLAFDRQETTASPWREALDRIREKIRPEENG